MGRVPPALAARWGSASHPSCSEGPMLPPPPSATLLLANLNTSLFERRNVEIKKGNERRREGKKSDESLWTAASFECAWREAGSCRRKSLGVEKT